VKASLQAPLQALALAGLFFLAFRFPAPSGLGVHEPLLAFLVPALALAAAYRGLKAGWLYLAFLLGLAGIFAFVPATLASKGPMPYAAALGASLLFWGYEALGFLAVTLAGRTAFRRWGFAAGALAAALALLLWETLAFHVYPWSWGAPYGALPLLARSAAFLGSPGLGAWSWGCGGLLAAALLRPEPLSPALKAAALWAGVPTVLGLAWFLLPQGPPRHLDVMMVQPNFDPGVRRPGMEADHWRRTDRLLAEAGWPRSGRRTLVLWAESSVLGRDDARPDLRLAEEARSRGVAWLYGTEGAPPGTPYLLWNLVRGEADGAPAFLQAKTEPMPFGEAIPGPAFLREPLERSLGLLSQVPGPLTDQSTFQVATPEGPLGIHPLICSEALMPDRTARGLALAGGDLLANHTNDGWFERSAATDLHAAQIRLRAVESGRPLLRATLTGKSGRFNADGTWQLWGEARSEGGWVFPLDWRVRRTPARWVGLPALLGAILALGLAAVAWRARRMSP